MRCPKCGHDNPKGVELCQGCRKVKFISKKKAGPAGGLLSKEPIPAAQPPSTSKPTVRVPRPASRAKIPPTDDGEGSQPAAPPQTKKTGKTARVVPPTIEVPPPTATRSTARKRPVAPLRHWLAPVGAPPIELEVGRAFTLGRDEACTLPIPSGRVSRLHAEIRWDGGKPVLVDKGSANGTYVGGSPVGEKALEPGDEIEIGPFLCVYKTGDLEVKPRAAAPLKTLIDEGELLGGAIKEGGLAEVLQGIDFNKKTGTLIVFSSEGQGWITFENGAPRAAAAGSLTHEEAVFSLLALGEGRFSFTSELRTDERKIKGTVTALLLEWGRRADERERSE